MEIVGFLRSGDELPRGFRFPVTGKSGNAMDVRGAGRLAQALDLLFPPYLGGPPEAERAVAWELIRASHGAGHNRPVNSGKLLVACKRSIASRQ